MSAVVTNPAARPPAVDPVAGAMAPDSGSLPATSTADVDIALDTQDPDELPGAEERLEESRERLREWMQQSRGRGSRRRSEVPRVAGAQPTLMDRLRSAPVVGPVVDGVGSWWSSHPMQPVASLAHGMVRDRVSPVVSRHPAAVVAAAFVAGLLLVRLRPWRWLLRPAVVAGLSTRLISRAVAAMPMDTLLDVAGSFMKRKAPRHADVDVAVGPPVPQAVVEARTVTP